MMFRISIGDNDYWFLIERIVKYIVEIWHCYASELQKPDDITKAFRQIFLEYLECAHVSEDTVGYVMDRLMIELVKEYDTGRDNGDAYYLTVVKDSITWSCE